jgi:hypothetical protein
MLRGRQKYPGGRFQRREHRRRSHGKPGRAQPVRGLSSQRPVVIARTRQNCDRHPAHDAHPIPPPRQLGKIIRPHQPDEADAGKQTLKLAQRIRGVAGAERRLDGRRHDPPSPDLRRTRQPFGQRRHAPRRLQRVAGRHHQPHLVQPQPVQRHPGHMQMPGMGRVERAAEQADRDPPPVAPSGDGVVLALAQGRTWPVPVTM